MKHKLLFVDDEENILSSMKRIFRGSEYELFYANSGFEGLEILKKNQISMIISDMKMPKMSGIEFLEASREYAPDAVKVILSAYSDIDDIMKAVNKGHIQNYLTKPWENERLKIVIQNGIESFQRIDKIKQLAKELSDKNDELKDINTNLEMIVQRRSKELFERNRILTLMLEGDEVSDTVKECVKSIGQLLEDKDLKLWLNDNSYLKKINDNIDPNSKELKHALELKKPLIINKSYYHPIMNEVNYFGLLIISPFTEPDKKRLSEIANISKLMTLIIQQNSNLINSDKLLESYDEIMEGLVD